MKRSIRHRSRTCLGGRPLVDVAIGSNEDAGEETGRASGIIAVGDDAHGWLALGDRARGAVALGRDARGAVAVGGNARGLFALGGNAVGGVALGGTATGVLAVGGAAFGVVAMGGLALGGVAVGGVALGLLAVGAKAVGRRSYGGGFLGKLRTGRLFLPVLLLCAPLTAAKATNAAPQDIFTDQSAATGLDFHHFNGMSGRYYFSEITGAGGALFDYDNDGDLDLYLVQGRMLGPDEELPKALIPPRHPLPLEDRLYRNDLAVAAGGSRRLRFTDVTEASGIEARAYGMGAAAGDYDNDGRVDLYVTNFAASNELWHNDGDGTFSDAAAKAGVAESRWSVAASFFDYDRDGWLDLYVGNYVDFTLARNKACVKENGLRDYCGPQSYAPEPDRLFRNRGDGTFEDVSEKVGITTPGATLGAVAADLDGNGWPDLYVANDMTPNQLWLNQGPGEDGELTFIDDALLLGCAVNREGRPEASMGVDAGDFDGDGDEDLFMTHLTRESNTLYVNDGAGLFHDRTVETGLANPSWTSTGFGTAWLDYDNDGRLDLLTVNGAIYVLVDLLRDGDPFPLHQTNQLFRNLGDGTFAEVTAEAGEVFELSEVSRGALFGDVDNDGDTDVVVANNSGPARLMVNEVGNRNRWLGLRLVTGDPPRDATGARVLVHREGKPPLLRRSRTDGSYASANDPRVLVGLGGDPAVSKVEVIWPDGRIEEWSDLAVDAYTVFVQGAGNPPDPPISKGGRDSSLRFGAFGRSEE